MQMYRLVLLVPLALAACVNPPAPPTPRPVPVARPAPQPAPAAPVANWADRAVAPGIWIYAPDMQGGIASFGQPGSTAIFTLRCDRTASRIYASRLGTVAARMTLRATTGARAYDARPTGGQPAIVAAAVDPRDPHLDALAFSRGRILVGLDGAADLILPIWPEFTRVVEDCRS
jgi:hypothetical protein